MSHFRLSFLTLLSLFSIAHSSQGQAEDLFDTPLEELMKIKVFSASRRETSALQVSAVVTVITEEELVQWGSENLGDALRYASGMTIRKGPGDFPQYLAAVRGNTSDFMNSRTLFLIDGVPVRNPNAGFDPSWIPVAMIKRIEIVKGPLSNLWGANAFGGLIQVITKSGADFQESHVKASAGYRTQNDHVQKTSTNGYSGSVSAGEAGERLDYMAAVSYFGNDDSKRSFTGHRYQDVFGKVSYHVSESLDLSLRSLFSLDRNQLALDIAGGPTKNDFTHLAGAAALKLDANSTINATAYLNRFSHFVDYTDALDLYDNQGKSYGITTQYTTVIGEKHNLVAGADFTNDSGSLSTNSTNYSTFPAVVEPAGWTTKFQNTWGAYSQYEYLGWQKFRPTAGARYDHNSFFGGALSPRVGLSYLLSENTNLFVSVGRGFRAPVFNETDIQGFGKVGHRDLKPEINTTYEIGFKSVYPSFQNTFSIFKQDISNKIELESINPADPNSLKRYANRGQGTIQGLELEGAYTPRKSFRLFYNSAILDSDDGSGGRIEKLIEMKLVLGMSLSVQKWTFGLIGIHEGNQFTYDFNSDRVFVDKITVANLEIRKQFAAGLSATLFVNNIGDHKYTEEYGPFVLKDGMYLPGRTIGATFNANF